MVLYIAKLYLLIMYELIDNVIVNGVGKSSSEMGNTKKHRIGIEEKNFDNRIAFLYVWIFHAVICFNKIAFGR